MSEVIDLSAKRVDVHNAVVGDTLTFPAGKVTYTDSNGVKQQYDLSNSTARMRIKNTSGDILYNSTSFSMLADGSYSHIATDVTTEGIPPGRHKYSVKFFFGDGIERTAFFGDINFVEY